VDKIRSWLHRKCQKLALYPTRSRLAACDFIYPSLPLKGPYSDSDYEWGLREQLHWQRLQAVLAKDGEKSEAGNMKAFDRMQKTMRDAQRRRFDPSWKPTFYSDPDHSALFQMSLGFGLEDLTADELAECFDRLCPCGKQHSADALKKQRQRIVRDLSKGGEFLSFSLSFLGRRRGENA